MKDKISTIEQIAISLWIIAQSLLIILTDINVLTLNSTIIFIIYEIKLQLNFYISPSSKSSIPE